MTEQQLNRLKQHLQSNAESTPSSLDNAILKAAQQKIEQSAESKQDQQTRSWFSRFIKSNFAQAGFVSVALTMLVFVGLALLIKPHSSLNVERESYAIEFEDEKSSREIEPKNTVNDIIVDLEMPETQLGRDQLLAQIPLPDVDEVLVELGFNDQRNEDHAKSLINIAMSDIRFMLDNKRFEKARIRYAQLKERCENCPLPDTLEALLINSSQGSG